MLLRPGHPLRQALGIVQAIDAEDQVARRMLSLDALAVAQGVAGDGQLGEGLGSMPMGTRPP
jgi:hypothetical protein